MSVGETRVGTAYHEVFELLTKEFARDEVKTRQGQGNSTLRYITARTAMNRLDEVLGPENWTARPLELRRDDDGFAVGCELRVNIGGETVTKYDYGQGGDPKSAWSDAVKRACVQLGVGRYLYRDGAVDYEDEPSEREAPSRAPAAGGGERREPARRQSPPNGQSQPGLFKLPSQGGRANFAWIKQLGQHYGVELTDVMCAEGDRLGVGRSIVAWDAGQLHDVFINALPMIKALDSYNGEFDYLDVQDRDVRIAPDTNGKGESSKQASELRHKVLEIAGKCVTHAGGDCSQHAEIVAAVGNLARTAKDSSGAVGRDLQSLKKCDDLVWLENIIKQGEFYLASDPNGDGGEEDDIPF